ncbi:hypothetical protein BDN70DRAFT_841370 [Pholiota conissans]|uniref:RecA family profile 1 domain-containing protein n=1 Tax=Pholiota conissans TaxID=109636 RepID=A0A9P5YT76_9AGAR|nr:hypothetical protein BDN70DRAFT_841370 [Pholiota conissans]
MSQQFSRRSLLSLGLPTDILAALTRHGYETSQDLKSINEEDLSKKLGIPLEDVRVLYARFEKPATSIPPLSMTQSAANMIRSTHKVSTNCDPLDKILGGGLPSGHILELSGPPGSPKERMALGILKSFVDRGEEAIFVDCLNMSTPSIVARALSSPTLQERVHYTSAHTLLDFLLFMHHLPDLLASHPQVSLLILNTISAPFQNADLDFSQKNFHQEKLKQTLSRVITTNSLTASIVTTSQLSTRVVNADGTAGTFDTGGEAIMLPSLGPSYLPSAKTYRVILAPDGMFSGALKLLSSPTHPPGKGLSQTVPYCIERS